MGKRKVKAKVEAKPQSKMSDARLDGFRLLCAGDFVSDKPLRECIAEIDRLRAEIAAKDAAEAQAVEFAWYALHFFGGGVQNGVYDDCAHEKARSAAEYLAARGLLRKTGERTWQRVEGI